MSPWIVAAPPNEPRLTGTIVGTVRFTGAVPEPTTITASDGSTIKHSDLAVDPKTKGLRGVVAVLQDAPAQPVLKDAKPAIVNQIEWVFEPRIVAVQHGQPVRFDNSDAVNHSVMALSKVRANQLNAAAGPGIPLFHTFEPQDRPVMIGCALHPWMRAWVWVVEHPWFAVSDAQGRFRIEQVPPGKYTVLLAHPDTRRREQKTIEVQAGKSVELTVEWEKVK